MDTTRHTRDVFLYCMALIYMFSFASWFIQIPGLYGSGGLLPAKNVLTNTNKPAEELFAEKPTLVWFMLFYGLTHQVALEVVCLLGVALSFLCLIFKSVRGVPMFSSLWFLYFSLFQVGQTFAWFQWDTLLLESGFLTILVSPSTPKQKNDSQHRLPFFLVRWLLFRLMFASGVVKLTSMCPTWWGLTALQYHFETQCIPTPLSWWAHQLPRWFLNLGVVGTYVIEIALPFLFFAPVRKLRLIAVYGQVLLMFLIILTGNYNFFNLLTVTLCLSVVDDHHLKYLKRLLTRSTGDRKERPKVKPFGERSRRYISSGIVVFTCFVYAYCTVKLFGLRMFAQGDVVFSKIEFTKGEFSKWTEDSVTASIWIGVTYFLWESMVTLYLCLRGKAFAHKLWNAFKYFIMLSVSLYMFTVSMVPFATISNTDLSWLTIRKWHSATEKFQLVHSYGLFRRMTGVGGRPEVVVEGSMLESGPWQEIPFLYKPGNTTRPLPWIAPHQPRLDWQMWFAALGQYQQNIWFVNFAHKILIGEPDVIKLLDQDTYPFKEKPPNYVRANLYHYRFTNLRRDGGIPKGVWTRKYNRAYLPVLHSKDEQLIQFLKHYNLHTTKSSRQEATTITRLRTHLEVFSAPVLLWALWLTAIIISVTKKYFMDARSE